MAQVRTRKRGYSTKVAAYNDYLHGNIGITSKRVTLKDMSAQRQCKRVEAL